MEEARQITVGDMVVAPRAPTSQEDPTDIYWSEPMRVDELYTPPPRRGIPSAWCVPQDGSPARWIAIAALRFADDVTPE